MLILIYYAMLVKIKYEEHVQVFAIIKQFYCLIKPSLSVIQFDTLSLEIF